MDADEIKRTVGFHAVERHVRSGMRIGMGTGTTAIWAIRRIGHLVDSGALTGILGVATSFQAQLECERLGIPVRSMNDPAIDGSIDLVIDGADEVDPNGYLTKGGGGALLLEKVVAYASQTVVIIVDEQKLVQRLGVSFPIPVEIAVEARRSVQKRIAALGGASDLRPAERKMGPVITDNGNPILDVTFADEFDPVTMERDLDSIPGVLANGLFASMPSTIYVGRQDGSVTVV